MVNLESGATSSPVKVTRPAIRSFIGANGVVVTVMGGVKRPEVKLHTLEEGSRFRMDNLDGTWTYGTLIFKNSCRVQVALSGGQQQVVFGEDGKQRKFMSDGRSVVSWPTEVMVEDITMADEDWRPDGRPSQGQGKLAHRIGREEDPEERGIHMATSETQAKGLNARYHHALKVLQDAQAAGDTGKEEVQNSRLTAIREEAEQKGITLAEPGAVPAQAEADATAEKADKTKKEKLAKNLKEAKPKTKAEKKEKKPKSTHDCICGCGRETQGLYAPGHDARVKGILISVERGKLEQKDIPEAVKPFVKFTGVYKTDGYKLVKAPVKIPGRDEVENSTMEALEALDV